MRLVGKLAQLSVALPVGVNDRIHRERGGQLAVVFLLRNHLGSPAAQLLHGAFDRAFGELAVQGTVDDYRTAPLELDQNVGRACLIDVLLSESNRWGAVGVRRDLLIKLLRLGDLFFDLLAQA